MRRVSFVLACLGTVAVSDWGWAQNTAQQSPAGAQAAPGALSAAGSYGIGMNIGRSMRSDGMQLDVESLVQGLRDGLQGAQSKYPEDQIRAALETLQRDMQSKQQQQEQTMADANKREGEAFLANNKTREGVKTLPSGLQYEVLKQGTGPSPKATDTVQVHYHGTLVDGRVFDSSVKRGQPAEFPVNGVIPGWTEALQLMKVGDKWKIYLPSDLAYGPRGAGRVIGPNAVLVFEVELLSVKPAQ
jgi:FKBP-type peptidyl-prolyl cis-trans isomerase FklB